jgi:hypothetical protein
MAAARAVVAVLHAHNANAFGNQAIDHLAEITG